jgi:hypothetical protein
MIIKKSDYSGMLNKLQAIHTNFETVVTPKPQVTVP